MAEPTSPQPPSALTASGRIASIDIVRGLTILVMIFVNDLAGVKGAPAWMKHFYPYDADGMTFVDIVFPAFLFIVGMAIPFALGRRLDRGELLLPILRHVGIRTLGLLIIGVFMVNSYTISGEGFLNPNLWSFLMYAGVILVWNQMPREPGRRRTLGLAARGIGILFLVIMAVVYRGAGEPGFIEMRTQWWGILGLIGWAYLVACIVFFLLRKNVAGMVGAMAILYLVFVADRVGFFNSLQGLKQYVDIGSMLGSLAAITVSGLILGTILTPDSPVQGHARRIRWALWYGLALYIAGRLTYSLHGVHKMFILNKNAATPPWCLISSAWTVWTWVLIYWLVDVKGWRKWSIVLRPAGENPLFAYILQPMLYAGFSLVFLVLGTSDLYARLGESFAIGFWRALLFAFGVTWLAGYLKKIGLRLRL